MVKRCNVRGCNSGQKSDLKFRRLNNLRHPSLFKVPKCPIERQKWIDSLKQTFAETDFVCDLHFMDSDIKKGETFLIDGKSMLMPHKKWTLKNGAIPSLEFTENEDSNKNACQSPNIHPNPIESGDNESQLSTEITVDNENEESNDNKIMIDEMVVIDSKSRDLRQNDISVSIKDIASYYSNSMPEGWAYFMHESEIIFIFFSKTDYQEQIRLRIRSGFTINVAFKQRPELLLDLKVESIETIANVFVEVQKWFLCDGISLKNKYDIEE